MEEEIQAEEDLLEGRERVQAESGQVVLGKNREGSQELEDCKRCVRTKSRSDLAYK